MTDDGTVIVLADALGRVKVRQADVCREKTRGNPTMSVPDAHNRHDRRANYFATKNRPSTPPGPILNSTRLAHRGQCPT
jgi:hypothetical protein